jgi:hypothetical protein
MQGLVEIAQPPESKSSVKGQVGAVTVLYLKQPLDPDSQKTRKQVKDFIMFRTGDKKQEKRCSPTVLSLKDWLLLDLLCETCVQLQCCPSGPWLIAR